MAIDHLGQVVTLEAVGDHLLFPGRAQSPELGYEGPDGYGIGTVTLAGDVVSYELTERLGRIPVGTQTIVRLPFLPVGPRRCERLAIHRERRVRVERGVLCDQLTGCLVGVFVKIAVMSIAQ